jgi:hypothetical protein
MRQYVSQMRESSASVMTFALLVETDLQAVWGEMSGTVRWSTAPGQRAAHKDHHHDRMFGSTRNARRNST